MAINPDGRHTNKMSKMSIVRDIMPRNTMIEMMLIAKLKTLLKIECEGGKRLSNTTGYGETDNTLPFSWVIENACNSDNRRHYTLTVFAQEWRKCLYADDSSITDEILMTRLSGWYATYKTVLAEWEEYNYCVDNYTWYENLIAGFPECYK